MTHAPDFDHALSTASRAVEAMQTLKVPPTPRNYELFYAHVSGANPSLSRAIQELAAGGALDDHAAETLYVKHVGGLSARTIEELGEKFDGELSAVLKTVDQAGQQTKAYGKALDVVSGQMDKSLDAATLKAIIGQMAAATRAMQARTASLEKDLAAAGDELKGLRSTLEGIRAEALTDGLTGLANRKSFDGRLAAAAREATEEGHELSLVFGDVDHFKSFNDTWGHQTGDQVLRVVAASLSENVKGRDTAARYGGEEFAVILPQTSLQNARILAEQIRQSVESKKVVKKSTGEALGTITISLGVATYRAGEPVDELLRRADACLYAAKRAGRNRVLSEAQVDVRAVLGEATNARAAKAA